LFQAHRFKKLAEDSLSKVEKEQLWMTKDYLAWFIQGNFQQALDKFRRSAVMLGGVCGCPIFPATVVIDKECIDAYVVSRIRIGSALPVPNQIIKRQYNK
jgi:hypothetical protein